MDFELTQEQRLLRDMARDFARQEIAPLARKLDETHEFPRTILGKLAGLGLLGMNVPDEFGGNPVDTISAVLALEEISQASAAVGIIVSVHCSLFCHSILTWGSDLLKKKYMPRAASGEILGAFSLTEPAAGSDALGLRATSVRRGDEYVLNGTKAWVTNGSEAGALILFTAAEGSSGKKRLNAFVVDRDSPGLKVSRLEEKMGLHASPTAEIVLEDCRVPAENLLGAEGQGATIAFASLDCSRIGIAAQAVGLARQALAEALRYAGERQAFGQKIADFQAIQFMLADMATETEAAHLMTLNAAALKDLGKPYGKAAAMAKLFASEAANRTASLALQVHGGYGYSKEFPVERLYRDARVLTLYEGTSEIQRLVIARHLLKEAEGKP